MSGERIPVERLFGEEGDESLASDMDEFILDSLWKLTDDRWPDGFTFVEFSVYEPLHHFPSSDLVLEMIDEYIACHGGVSEDWELGGGSEDTAAADTFLKALADNVTYRMADAVLATHKLTLDGRQPLLDGEPYGPPFDESELPTAVDGAS